MCQREILYNKNLCANFLNDSYLKFEFRFLGSQRKIIHWNKNFRTIRFLFLTLFMLIFICFKFHYFNFLSFWTLERDTSEIFHGRIADYNCLEANFRLVLNIKSAGMLYSDTCQVYHPKAPVHQPLLIITFYYRYAHPSLFPLCVAIHFRYINLVLTLFQQCKINTHNFSLD